MACTVKTCCCCMSLKTGTILASIYTLLIGLIGSVFCIRIIIMLRTGKDLVQFIQEVLGMEESPDGLDTYFSDDNSEFTRTLDVAQIIILVTLCIYLLWILCAILVFIGLCCKVRCCLIPWVVITAIITGFCIWGIINHVKILVGGGGFQTTWDLAYFVQQCVVTALNFYCVLVVSSFHKRNMEEFEEVEMERYGPEDY